MTVVASAVAFITTILSVHKLPYLVQMLVYRYDICPQKATHLIVSYCNWKLDGNLRSLVYKAIEFAATAFESLAIS